MRLDLSCILSGRRRARRALVALLGLACALWTAQQFFHYEMDPSAAALYNFSVSDEELSFQIPSTSMPGAATDYSWEVEGDCLYLRIYGSCIANMPFGRFLGKASIHTGRRINRIVVVGRGREVVYWEANKESSPSSAAGGR